MKLRTVIAALAAILSLGASAERPRAEPARLFGLPAASLWTERAVGRWPHHVVVGDTVEIVARRTPPLGSGVLYNAFVRDPLAALRTGTVDEPMAPKVYSQVRPADASLFATSRPSTIAPSRFSRLLLGADLGAGTVSSVAGAGLVTGLWGEKTAGYMMGAGAILGALWGGTIGSESSALRIRVGLDDSQWRWDRYNSQRDDSGLTGPPR